MEKKIALIKGDGIGPEIVDQAVRVLDKICEKYGHTFHYQRVLMGGESIDATGLPLTDQALADAKASDAVLLGSVGGPSGTTSPDTFARKRACSKSARDWGCLPTFVPPTFILS